MKRRGPSISGPRRSSIEEDAATLASQGQPQELKRNFSTLSMLGLAFAILNSWTALSASLSLALPSGGPSVVIWGLIVAGTCNLCLAASLAEFMSCYPSAGGQYHWVAIISWKKWVPLLSWITGWINVSGWIALVATAGLLGSQLIVGIIAFKDQSYQVQRWHQFLIYLGFTLIEFIVNAFLTKLLPLINKGAFTWSVAGFVIISITVLACASPNYQPASFVYGEVINESGWSTGFSWMLGLLQGALALTGYDATIHMAEELGNPAVEGPRILLQCIGIGMFTGFVFLTCLLFVVTDINQVIGNKSGPLLQIFFQATGSQTGSICLLMFPIVCLLFAGVSIMTTSSRMTWAFARDGGLPASKFFARIHPKLELPLNAMYLTAFCTVIFGCIFLGSSSAFNAITAAAVVCLGLTYAIPPAINCLRGRKMLPETRSFKLPGPMGWICNLVGICWTLLTTVLFVFPPDLPVTGNNMNYCIAAFAIIIIISTVQWFLEGRKHYKGPQIDESALKSGQVMGMSLTNEESPVDNGEVEKKASP